MNTQKDSLYEHLNIHNDGEFGFLMKIFNKEEIEHLCKIGFLSRGEDADKKERYKLTSLGKRQIKVRCTRDRIEHSMDAILTILR